MHQFYSELENEGKVEYFNFFFIGQLLGQFKETQRFFCNLHYPTKIERAKMKLEVLIGEQYLIELHEMFPEILQIGREIGI